MKTKDYLKRAFSAVVNENSPARTSVLALAVAVPGMIGVMNAVDRDPSVVTAQNFDRGVQAETLKAYLAEAKTFAKPEIVGADGWDKLQNRAANFAERVLQDARLAEADVAQIIATTKNGTYVTLAPGYLWFGKDYSPNTEMNSLEECRLEQARAGGTPRAVYDCAVSAESLNRTRAGLAGLPVGIGLALLMMLSGRTGRRWEREAELKKLADEHRPLPAAPTPADEAPAAVVVEQQLVPPVRKLQKPKFD